VWCALQAFSVAHAKEPTSVSLYRYVLDMDVPEAAALVPLNDTPTRTLLATTEKPVMATLALPLVAGDGGYGLAIDVSPYYALGGGQRDLHRYRSNSIVGRLTRVATKAVISIAALPESASARSTPIALALRTTFHDPRDPVLNSSLPEDVASALDA